MLSSHMCSIGRSENEHPSRAIRRDVAAKTASREIITDAGGRFMTA